MATPRTVFRGSMVALATPFRDGKVDDAALRRLVDFQLNGGTDVLVPCGTTGESPTLTVDERQHVTAVVVEQARGRAPVLAGGPGNDTAASVDAARRAKAAGAHGILAVTPYYNKPSQEGHVRHLAAIAEVGLPVLAYNVPSRTGTDLLPETVARLHHEGIIIGVKEATGSLLRLLDILEQTHGELVAISGDDFTAAPFILTGGQGVISVSANVVPRHMKALVQAALQGDRAGAVAEQLRLQPLHRALFIEGNPIPLKSALAELGLCGPGLRLPLTPLSEMHLPALRAALAPLRAREELT
jgi:4-hydroxy-tetrahydrodipicolinate synthase